MPVINDLRGRKMNLHRPIADLVELPEQENSRSSLLDKVSQPEDIRKMPRSAMKRLADEVRSEMISIVSETGGHLGAGLGVVELTVALHRVFDTPRDKLLWDVSHQCYPHKILTGRRASLRKLRQSGGPSGFTKITESRFDPFGAAHSSTSISAGLGFAVARDFDGMDFSVVSVIGDGAMTGGMAFEGLNNAGAQGRRQIVVLNDNSMSIAPPAGALEGHLQTLRNCLPSKTVRKKALQQSKLPSFSPQPTLFDNLGIRYAGPFDGHDMDEMLTVLEQARRYENGPLLVHVLTDKGKGYAPAEKAADKYHGVKKFDIRTGEQAKSPAGPPSYTNVFAKALIAEAKADSRVAAITAAMPSGTGLDKFAKAFPDRCFDAGIAEQHAVTFCAGMAAEGYRPFAAIYSTFLQRAYDQIVHDVAIQRLPVRFAIDRAGMVGADGVTHQGSYDISYLGCLPGFVLMAPSDETELMHMVATAAAIDDRPSAIRFPRGEGTGSALPDRGDVLEIGRGRIVLEGGDVAILSYGTRLADALMAASLLAEQGIKATVADARFAKPVDHALVAQLARNHPLLVTLEEGAVGGFSAQVFDSLVYQRRQDCLNRVLPMYLPDLFIDHDAPGNQIRQSGLHAEGIAARVLESLRLSGTGSSAKRLI